jgi:LacI family transcriptional regulator, repressor for deo operon, udp, cdd, tsx, nupC, and nupG
VTEPKTQGPAVTTEAAKKHARAGKGNATIYDIAKVAGVNPSTVSRALSKPGRVSAKTQKLIEDAAAELNYQVNPFARALPTGRTNTFGLIVADITNPTFFDIIRGAETTGTARDYTLVLAESAESAATELTAARRMMSTADGLILASPRMDDDDIRALSRDKPVVVINREVEGVPCVIPDVRKGIGEAVRSLAANGHKKLAFVAGPARSWMSARRWEGVQAACEWSKLEPVRVESTKPTVDGGRQVARDVLATKATAVLTYNDLLAIGLMQELQAGGMVVPDQISIVGFDDIFGADFTTPPLTTVRSPLGECGSGAAALLLELLHGNGDPAGILRVETELVLRGSSGRLLPKG